MKTDLSILEQKIRVRFEDKELLQNVFVHRSYLNENKDFPLESNEKLEFLGDSVLSLATSIYLFKNFSGLQEGDYTDIKAAIVRTETLAEVAQTIALGDYILLSHGEQKNKGKEKKSILADTFEALIAAIFIDKNFETAYTFLSENLFDNRIRYIVDNKLYQSPKSRLQEIIQGRFNTLPEYIIEREVGPEHKKEFYVKVVINNKLLGKASGRSKKQAQELAAEKALEKMKK